MSGHHSTAHESTPGPRTMVLWCPDWPVMAALQHRDADTCAAVLANNAVVACTPAARRDGVRRGMRRRDAQTRCPELVLLDHAPDDEARAFEDVLTAIEHVSPGVAALRPGLCAVRVPSRFYGSERNAAAVLAEQVVTTGVWDVRVGVADGQFAAQHAARQAATHDVVIIDPGQSRAFLAGLPIEALDDADLVSLLRRLGLRTVGDFAALDPRDVHTRFGAHGHLLHTWACGRDPHPISRRKAPADLELLERFEPPLVSAESLAFSLRSGVEAWVKRLADIAMVCTAVRIEVDVDGLVASSRRWAHPRWFGPGDLIDRVRWQVGSGPLPGPVEALRLIPEDLEPLADHADPLFGAGADERVERAVARVQSLIGHQGVQTMRVQGGRDPGSRQGGATWGERISGQRPVERPWPGRIPEPAPATVYRQPRAAGMQGPGGLAVAVTERGALSCEPTRFRADETEPWQQVTAWAGPWPVDEQWWDEASARRIARFQVVGADGSAWLMVIDDGRWFTEARYD